MFFSVESELPSGTRLRLQRDGKLWVASFASQQFVIRPGDVGAFTERARSWAEGNVTGASLVIAYAVIRHYTAIIAEVDDAGGGYPAAPRETRPAVQRSHVPGEPIE